MTLRRATSATELQTQTQAMAAQHEALASLMRTLAERDSGGASKRELTMLLRELESQTAGHFRDEEAYMRDVGHPKLDTHQLIHRDLLAMLRRHVDEFVAGDGRLGCKLRSFFVYWLGSHLEGMDRQLASHARSLSEPGSGVHHAKPVAQS